MKRHFGTIYREIKRDKRKGGRLFLHLRHAQKQRHKCFGRPDSRGRLPGKHDISERPKTISLENLPQSGCAFIKIRLNQGPRKLLNFKTPEECYLGV